jgi:hypothetical protein
MVLLLGSLAAMKGKARSSTPDSAHQPKNTTREVVERLSDGRAQARRRRRGKNGEGVLLRSFYRWKSPDAPRTTSQIVSPMESRIESKFGYILRKSIQDKVFGFWVLTDWVGDELFTGRSQELGRLGTHTRARSGVEASERSGSNGAGARLPGLTSPG